MARLHALSVRQGLFLIAAAATAWGVGGFVAAILYNTSGLGPIAVSFWRFASGALLLAALRPLVAGGGWRVHPAQVLVTGAGFAVYQTAYYAAIQLTGLAIGTVVTLGAGPVLIAVGARVFLGERLGVRGGLTVAASVAGLVLLTWQSSDGGSVAGVAVALLSATGYAGVTLLRRGTHGDGDAFDSVFGGFAVGALCVLPLAAGQGLVPATAGLGQTLGLLAFLGIVPTALAYAAFFAGLTVVRATTASVVALVEPLAAAILAVTVLGERLTLGAAAGGAVLLAAVAVLARQETRPATSVASAGSARRGSPR
jgi:DME family drug/metabolite transporter